MVNKKILQDTHWMHAALAQAQAAQADGEIPVGAVVVHNGSVIGIGRNSCIHANDPCAHAEIIALRAAAQHIGNYRLDDCTLYVTLEPCTMCAGAILHSRLKRVVFGAPDPKTGAAGSVLNVFALQQINHHTQVLGGVLLETCAELLQNFFKQHRSQQQFENRQAGRGLRDDALRTPESRFTGLPDRPTPSVYVNDLPSLAGLRLHYIDAGLRNAAQTFFCLHDSTSWCYAWRHLAAQAGSQMQRVICPDLVGFGQSDKPKKSTLHTLQWHVQILLELIDRLDLNQFTLLAPVTASKLAQLLLEGAAQKCFKISYVQTAPMNAQALEAPFPDAGHRVALRAFSCAKMQLQQIQATAI